MVSFRRYVLALAVLALFAGLAGAQVQTSGGSTGGPLTCTAAPAATPILRAEGVTELIGDIVITCTGGAPAVTGALVQTANITVSLGTIPITSKVLGSGLSEALLLIDEPGTAPGNTGAGAALAQSACSSMNGTGPGGCGQVYANNNNVAIPQSLASFCTTFTGSTCTTFGTTPNVFQGVVSGSTVTFNGIPVLAPASAGIARVFRITNVRANVGALGGATGTIVNAFISVSGVSPFGLNTPTVTPGIVQAGLSTSVHSVTNGTGSAASQSFLQCQNNGSSSSPAPGAILHYQENFATAFKTRVASTATSNGVGTTNPSPSQNTPGMIYNSESGFITPAVPGAGVADYGTRLKAVFSNIPAGVSVYVTTSNIQYNYITSAFVTGSTLGNSATYNSYTLANGATSPAVAELVLSETAPDFSGFVPAANPTVTLNSGNLGLAQVQLVNGSGEAVWEFVQGNPSGQDMLDFGVFFVSSASQGTAATAPVSGQVQMWYAPTPNSPYGNNSTTTVPQFVNPTSTPASIVTLSPCVTTLLYPFVTNENGFETGLSIANTTTDTLGTKPQNGTCAMTFYGDNPGPTTTTAPCTNAGACLGTVKSGTVYANTLTGILGSSFQGYAIATCNFQYAHGFAFISDAHATNLAMGYLALVVVNRPTPETLGF